MDTPNIISTIKHKLKYIDKTYWTVFILLVVFAVIELFSASSTLAFKTGSLLGPIWHQVKFILMGAALAFTVQLLPSRYVRGACHVFLWISGCCLYLMLIPGNPFVSTINGAERWFKLFGFSFQPSELAKLSLIVVVADYLSRAKTEEELTAAFYKTLGLTAGIVFPIMLGNLSTALLLTGVIFLMWFLARVPFKYLIGVVSIAVVMLVSGYFIVEYGFIRAHKPMHGPFKRAITWVNRIDDFIYDKQSANSDSTIVITDDNYQRIHATLAVARGGASPIGVLPGNSVERNFLPLAYADYIFSIIVEETGLFGAIVLIVLYMVILFRACNTSSRYAGYGAMLMVMGLALMLTCQAFVSMAVAVGLGPVTGQPLPMVTRGGTSVLLTSMYFAILMCVSREQNEMKAMLEQSRADSFDDVPDVNLE